MFERPVGAFGYSRGQIFTEAKGIQNFNFLTEDKLGVKNYNFEIYRTFTPVSRFDGGLNI